jgi:hypothetical protein
VGLLCLHMRVFGVRSDREFLWHIKSAGTNGLMNRRNRCISVLNHR